MNKKINIKFIDENETINIETKNITQCDVFKVITCLLENMHTTSYIAIRDILNKAEKEYKSKKD